MVVFQGYAGQVLWFDGEGCRTCGQPATHYLVRPVRPERWVDRGEMSILAVQYCNACSPAVAHDQPREPLPAPPMVWWERALDRLAGAR